MKLFMLKDDQDQYHTQIITTVGGMKDTEYHNKGDFADMAIFKVSIDTVDKDRKKRWTDALEKAKDKKVPLYLLVDAHTLDGQTEMHINYLGDTEEGEIRGEKVTNRWLDVDEAWFELKGCLCCDFKVDSDGFVDHEEITKEQVTEIEQGNFSDPKKSIKHIVLHRTVTATARGTIDNGFKKKRGGTYYGTHFLVGKNGKIYQCASLKKYTYHVSGKNSKSIGIEVVGQPYDKDGVLTAGYPHGNPVDHWDSLPKAQAESVACVVNGLLKYYGLNKTDIKNHEDLQAKAKGEGKTVYDAIINLVK